MKKGYRTILTVCMLLIAYTAVGQQPDKDMDSFPSTEEALSQIGSAAARSPKQPADTAALTSPAQRKGFIRRIIDYYSRSNIDRTFEKKIDWSIAPGPNYSSDVGFGIGFLVAGLYRIDRTDSVTAPSNISIYGNVTTEKFVLLRFSGDNIFNHNKQRLSYAGAFVYFPGAFYGVGYNAGAEGYAQELTTTMGIFRISYCTALAGRFYIGVSGGIDYTGAKYKDTGMVAYMNNVKADVDAGKPVPGGRMGELYTLWQEGRYDPAKQDPFSNYITESGDNPNAFNTSLGLFAQYDTRDVTFNASRGIFIKAEAKWYPEWLGNTRRNFGRFTLTFDFYRKLWKGAIFAYDLYADFTAGTPSWHMYAKMGGMERMRLLRRALPRQKARRDADRAAPENLPPPRRRSLDRRRTGLGHRQSPLGQHPLQLRLRLPVRVQEPDEHPPRLRLGRLRQPKPAVGSQTLLGLPLHGLRSLLRACAARTGHIWESPSRGGAFPCGNPAGTIPYIP